MRPFVGRADIVAAWLEEAGDEAVRAIASMAGFRHEPALIRADDLSVERRRVQRAERKDEPAPQSDDESANWEPTPVWAVIRRRDRRETAREEVVRAEPISRGDLIPRATKDPSLGRQHDLRPLIPWRQLGPRLWRRMNRSALSRAIDVPRLVDHVAQGRSPYDVPPRRRQVRAASVWVIIDLIGLGGFQLDRWWLLDRLRARLGAHGVFVSTHADGIDRPSIESLEGRTEVPSPETPVLALTDLGGSHQWCAQAWRSLGVRLRARGHQISALLPTRPSGWAPWAITLWNAGWWDRGARGTEAPQARARQDDVEQSALFCLLGPLLQCDEKLLRDLRLLLPPHAADAEGERDVMRCFETGEGFDESTLERRLVRFLSNPCALEALELVRRAHAELPPEIWHEEVFRLGTVDRSMFNEGDWAVAEPVLRALSPDFKKACRFYICMGATVAAEGVDDKLRDVIAHWVLRGERRTHDGVAGPDADNEAATAIRSARQWAHGFVAAADDEAPRGLNPEDMPLGDEEPVRSVVRALDGHFAIVRSDSVEALSGTIASFWTGTDFVYFERVRDRSSIRLPFRRDGRDATRLPEVRGGPFVLTSDVDQIRVERVEKPEWADGIRSSARGVSAWVETDSGRLTLDLLEQPRGWSLRELPNWATDLGVDDHGLWAEVTVSDAAYRMRWIPPGEFVMGSPLDEEGRNNVEVQHRVTLTRGFWLGETPVTQAFWEAVTGENPSAFSDPARPVERVSWRDCDEFPRRLGDGFRLPSEAEWEYACRAGSADARYGPLDDVAWYGGNSADENDRDGRSTRKVATKQANRWGLYDMLGNVWEW